MNAAAVTAAVAARAGSAILTEAALVVMWLGDTLVSGGADGTLAVDGIPALGASGGLGAVTAMASTPSGEVVVLDHRGGVRAGTQAQELGGWGRRLWWSGPDCLVAVTSAGVHRGPVGGLRAIETLEPVAGVITDACLVSDDSLAVGTTEGLLFVDLQLDCIDGRRTGPTPFALARSPGGQLLAVGYASGAAHVLHIGSGDGVEVDGSPDPVRLLCWAGRRLVVVDGTQVTAWPVTPDGRVPVDLPICLVKGDAPVTALSPAGARPVVAAGDAQGTLWLLAAEPGAAPLATLDLGARVVSLAWSSDGTRLAAGCLDGGLHRYDVALV